MANTGAQNTFVWKDICPCIFERVKSFITPFSFQGTNQAQS